MAIPRSCPTTVWLYFCCCFIFVYFYRSGKTPLVHNLPNFHLPFHLLVRSNIPYKSAVCQMSGMDIFNINWWSFLRTDQHWASMLQWDVRGLLGIMANVAICKCLTSDLMGWRSWSSYLLFNGYKHIFFFYSKQHILNGKWSKSTNKNKKQTK